MKNFFYLFLSLTLLMTTYCQSSRNFITNGDFKDNSCRSGWCIGGSPDLVPGWIPDPAIEIGWGNFYSDFVGTGRVVELAPENNSCIYQVVKNLQSGNYLLRVEYAAKRNQIIEDSMWSASVNGQLLKEVKAQNYQLQNQNIRFSLSEPRDATIRLCSIGGRKSLNNAQGAVLKSVSLTIEPLNQRNPAPITSPTPITQSAAPSASQSALTPIRQNQNQVPVNDQGLTFDSHSGRCFQKEYQLQGGQLSVSFDYALSSSTPVRQSSTVVIINGNPIYKVDASNNGKNVKLQGKLEKGSHLVGFCPVGSNNEQVHQVTISNIKLSETVCSGEWTSDLIENGGFEKNPCKINNCIFTNKMRAPFQVEGWIANPEIEVVKVSVQNPAIGSTWAAELAGTRNTCIRQNINLQPGKVRIGFHYAARLRTNIKDKGFDVKVNGNTIKSYNVTDFKVNGETVEIDLDKVPSGEESFIEFCGTGPNNAFGVLLDNVEVRNFDACAKSQIINY